MRYIYLGLLPLIFAGCSKFLEHVPDDRTDLKDVEAVKALLVSAYPDGHYMMAGELMSDNADDKGSYQLSMYPEMQEEAYFWENSTQLVQDAPSHYWTRVYKAISAANHAIEAINNNGNGPEYAPYLGEALMCRAFNHFLLVNFWAKHYDPATAATDLGIPYVTEPEKEALVDYKRNTVKEVYDLIEDDITKGFPLLADNAYDVPKYHFTRAAASAFIARFYLFRGEAGDWNKVIQYPTTILGTNFKAQLRDYAGKYVPISSDASAYQQLYGNFGEPAILLLTNASSLWYYSSRAGRYGMSFNVLNEVMTTSLASTIRNNRWVGFVGGSDPHLSLMKFYPYLRVAYPGASSGLPYVLCPILTVEEAVFNRAEANVMVKNFDAAINDINIYLSPRTRNYSETANRLGMKQVSEIIPTPTPEKPDSVRVEYSWVYDSEVALSTVVNAYTASLTAIKLEPWYHDQLDNEQMCMLQYITDLRRREFLQEGVRWFDVKRFHIEVTHRVRGEEEPYVLTKDDPRRAWQIPSAALSYGIEPNPRTVESAVVELLKQDEAQSRPVQIK